MGMDASSLKVVLEKINELSELLQGVAMIGEVIFFFSLVNIFQKSAGKD